MSEWKEIKSDVVSWGKVGDSIEGTLINVRERDVRDDEKGTIRKKIYEIRADAGSYHNTDDKKNPVEPPVTCEKGTDYLVWGGKEAIDGAMKKVKMGQKVQITFADELEPKRKGYSGFKIIKVRSNGLMDEEWLGGQEIDPKEVV